jgi:hypothetical protein
MGFFEDIDEILFFIIVFLFLFISNLFERDHNKADRSEGESSSIIFFIILFILVFFNINWVNDPT